MGMRLWCLYDLMQFKSLDIFQSQSMLPNLFYFPMFHDYQFGSEIYKINQFPSAPFNFLSKNRNKTEGVFLTTAWRQFLHHNNSISGPSSTSRDQIWSSNNVIPFIYMIDDSFTFKLTIIFNFFRPYVEYKGAVPQDELKTKQNELEVEANKLISKGGKVSRFFHFLYWKSSNLIEIFLAEIELSMICCYICWWFYMWFRFQSFSCHMIKLPNYVVDHSLIIYRRSQVIHNILLFVSSSAILLIVFAFQLFRIALLA